MIFYSIKVGTYGGALFGYIVNGKCDQELNPANGNCSVGWNFFNGTHWVPDSNIIIECKGELSYLFNHTIGVLGIKTKLDIPSLLKLHAVVM